MNTSADADTVVCFWIQTEGGGFKPGPGGAGGGGRWGPGVARGVGRLAACGPVRGWV